MKKQKDLSLHCFLIYMSDRNQESGRKACAARVYITCVHHAPFQRNQKSIELTKISALWRGILVYYSLPYCKSSTILLTWLELRHILIRGFQLWYPHPNPSPRGQDADIRTILAKLIIFGLSYNVYPADSDS